MHNEVVELLASYPETYINEKDYEGKTPLQVAFETWGSGQITELLTKYASQKEKSKTLPNAADKTNSEVRKEEATKAINEGKTPIYIADTNAVDRDGYLVNKSNRLRDEQQDTGYELGSKRSKWAVNVELLLHHSRTMEKRYPQTSKNYRKMHQ